MADADDARCDIPVTIFVFAGAAIVNRADFAFADRVYHLAYNIPSWRRQDGYYAMTRRIWDRLVMLAVEDPDHADQIIRRGPMGGDTLFGFPLIVTDHIDDIVFVARPESPLAIALHEDEEPSEIFPTLEEMQIYIERAQQYTAAVEELRISAGTAIDAAVGYIVRHYGHHETPGFREIELERVEHELTRRVAGSVRTTDEERSADRLHAINEEFGWDDAEWNDAQVVYWDAIEEQENGRDAIP